jgi:hypothetical protein
VRVVLWNELPIPTVRHALGVGVFLTGSTRRLCANNQPMQPSTSTLTTILRIDYTSPK